mmetsp:Transcript_49338/g.127280  ORF Transcript_49338/g.127280 Transcript_49338/m.127280 type:complete len:250 (-) Transcript_49338:206-955(-)
MRQVLVPLELPVAEPVDVQVARGPPEVAHRENFAVVGHRSGRGERGPVVYAGPPDLAAVSQRESVDATGTVLEDDGAVAGRGRLEVVDVCVGEEPPEDGAVLRAGAQHGRVPPVAERIAQRPGLQHREDQRAIEDKHGGCVRREVVGDLLGPALSSRLHVQRKQVAASHGVHDALVQGRDDWQRLVRVVGPEQFSVLAPFVDPAGNGRQVDVLLVINEWRGAIHIVVRVTPVPRGSLGDVRRHLEGREA